jgi:hypothetical protein
VEGPSLDDAFDKLRWSKYHFEVLRAQIEPFEQRDTHSIRVEVDPETGKYEFYVFGLEVPDPDWGLMIGDCLHNARTALDYVMVRLWARITGQDPGDVVSVQFPVYNDPKKFASATGEARKELAFSGYLARIEELQPFNTWNPSVWGFGLDKTPASLPSALDRLSFLDNIDKHRVVHATWVGTKFGAWLTAGSDAPASYRSVGGSIPHEPLNDGAKVGEWTFQTPLPGDWKPSEMQMKGYFPLQVSFPDPSPVKGVLEILPWCISGVEAVIEIFRPVFESGAPPLPVTAVRTVRG